MRIVELIIEEEEDSLFAGIDAISIVEKEGSCFFFL